MLKISRSISIPDNEIKITAVRSQGPGGQSVNKSATAVHLRFDVQASSLSDDYKERILALNDQRVTDSGVIIIKSQRHRSLEDNRKEALARLNAIIRRATASREMRKPTRPTLRARNKRMDQKARRGRLKFLRGRVDPQDH